MMSYEDEYIKKDRFSLIIDSVQNTLANDNYYSYVGNTSDTIEGIIDEVGYFVSEIIIDHPEIIFSDCSDEQVNYLREQKIGFEDSVTGASAKYVVGDIVDAYVKKMMVDVMPLVEGFWLDRESNNEE